MSETKRSAIKETAVDVLKLVAKTQREFYDNGYKQAIIDNQELIGKRELFWQNEVKEAKEEVARGILQIALDAISAEPEFPGDMPDELWELINGNREKVDTMMKNAVRLTKEGITERLQSKFESKHLKAKSLDKEV